MSRKTKLGRREVGGRSSRPAPSRGTDFDTSRLRLAIVIVVGLKLAGLVLLFDTSSASAFDAAKSSFSLGTTWLLLAFCGIALLRYGTGTLVRTRLHLCVAAFVLANVVSAVFAQDPYMAVYGAQRRLGLTFVLDMLVLYFAVALAYRTKIDWAVLGGAVACAGLVAIGYGFAQYFGLDPIRWADEVRSRPPSTFGNADKFGHFLGATVVAAAGVAALPVPLSRRVRGSAAIYLGAALVMAVLVATRGTALGLVVGLPALAVIYLRLSHFRTGQRLTVVTLGAVLGGLVLAGALIAATPLGSRMLGGFGDVATQQRYFTAEAAIRAFSDRPIVGHGPDNFGAIYPRYRPVNSIRNGILVNQDSAHSWLLQTATTTGALGTLSLAAMVVGSLFALWRGIANVPVVAAPLFLGGLAYWAQGLVALGSVSVDWIGWLAVGGAATLGRRPAAAPARSVGPVLQAVPILAAVVLVIFGYAAFQANRELYLARTLRSDRAPAAERAVLLDPGRAEHWFALGQARGSLPQAAEAFRMAAERAPHVSAHWTNLAIALANLALKGDESMGGRDAAITAARRGVAADPNYPTPYHVLALVLNGFGDHAAALEASATAIRLHNKDSAYDAVAADAATRLADASVARTYLEQIVRDKDIPLFRVALARVSLKLNDRVAALSHVRRTLELDPQNASARELLLQLGVSPP